MAISAAATTKAAALHEGHTESLSANAAKVIAAASSPREIPTLLLRPSALAQAAQWKWMVLGLL